MSLNPSLSTEQRFEKMKEIRDELLVFKESPIYEYRVKNKYFPVVGEGSHTAKIMFIGEAPGKQRRKRLGRFVGDRGNSSTRCSPRSTSTEKRSI